MIKTDVKRFSLLISYTGLTVLNWLIMKFAKHILINICQHSQCSSEHHPDASSVIGHDVYRLGFSGSAGPDPHPMGTPGLHRKALLGDFSSDPHRPGLTVFRYASDTLGRNGRELIAGVFP